MKAVFILWTGALAVLVGGPPNQGSAPLKPERLAIAETTFQAVVKEKCRRFPCLLAFDGAPIPKPLEAVLSSLGKAKSIVKGDVATIEGVLRPKRTDASRIFNLTGIEIKDDRAQAVVDDLTGGAGRCVYSLRKTVGAWTLVKEETRCTLS